MNVLDLFSGIGVSVSDLKLSECTPQHFANAIRTLKRCSESIGRTLRSIQTSEPSTEANTRIQSTSFVEDSPAKTSVLQANAPVLPANVQDCIGRYYEPFAWFDPN